MGWFRLERAAILRFLGASGVFRVVVVTFWPNIDKSRLYRLTLTFIKNAAMVIVAAAH